MLDTNTISYVISGRSLHVRRHIHGLASGDQICISVITEAEVRFGLARKPGAHRRAHAVDVTLSMMTSRPWTSAAAKVYAGIRAGSQPSGVEASDLDLLIAAHAVAEGAVLVTSDAAISKLVGGPETVNWADDLRLN